MVIRRTQGLLLDGTVNLLIGAVLLLFPAGMVRLLGLPLRGKIALWVVAVVVLAIGLLEIASKSWKCDGPAQPPDGLGVEGKTRR